MGLAIRTAVNAAEAKTASRRSGIQAPPPEKQDETLEKLHKLVPAEVVAFYVGITHFLAPEDAGYRLAVFLIGTLATPVILWLATRSTPEQIKLKPPQSQYLLRTAAFVLWATATADPFKLLGGPVPAKAVAIALAVFTMFSPFIVRDAPADPAKRLGEETPTEDEEAENDEHATGEKRAAVRGHAQSGGRQSGHDPQPVQADTAPPAPRAAG